MEKLHRGKNGRNTGNNVKGMREFEGVCIRINGAAKLVQGAG